jgi:hypothetical protein
MYPHRIRLRGPWECEPLSWWPGEMSRPVPAPLRMTMPCRLGEGGLPAFLGRVRLRRRFGYPGQIDAHERIWLTFADVAGPADFFLNGRPLGQREGSFEVEATQLLQARNELIVDWEAAGPDSGLPGEVALEVRCQAYLKDVRVIPAKDGLRVHGRVEGSCVEPLELYVITDRSTAAYGRVEPGQWFDLEGAWPDPGEDPVMVRVELVRGATVWHTDERQLSRQGKTGRSQCT